MVKKFECKVFLSRVVEADDEEEAQNKFWDDLNFEFSQENTTLVVELNESMLVNLVDESE